MEHLSYKDIRALADAPSSEMRGTIALKIANDFCSNKFTEAEAALAGDIFHIILKDAHTTLRASIAEQLTHCAYAPHDIIVQLAHDPYEISSPILRFSLVLTEDDLIAIVHSTKEVAKLCAIAGRESISEGLSSSLLQTSDILVYQNLFQNGGAAINPSDVLKKWELIAPNSKLLETLVQRGGLSLVIAEKIYQTATQELRDILAKQYKLNIPFLYKATDDAKEWAVLGLIDHHHSSGMHDEQAIEDFVDGLHFNGRLTHSLLIRALCSGNMGIFECGLAKLAGVPRVNARILMMDAGGFGLKAIYEATSLPEGFFAAIKILVQICLEETDFGRTKPEDFRKHVIERIYIKKYDRTVENMEYMLSIISGKLIASANVH